MSDRIVGLLAWALLAGLTLPAVGQQTDPPGAAGTIPAPPADFDKKRDGIGRGRLETVEYDSATVGAKRKATAGSTADCTAST